MSSAFSYEKIAGLCLKLELLLVDSYWSGALQQTCPYCKDMDGAFRRDNITETAPMLDSHLCNFEIYVRTTINSREFLWRQCLYLVSWQMNRMRRYFRAQDYAPSYLHQYAHTDSQHPQPLFNAQLCRMLGFPVWTCRKDSKMRVVGGKLMMQECIWDIRITFSLNVVFQMPGATWCAFHTPLPPPMLQMSVSVLLTQNTVCWELECSQVK